MPPQWIAARPRTGRLNSVVLHPRPKLPSAFQHMHDKQPAHSHICQSSMPLLAMQILQLITAQMWWLDGYLAVEIGRAHVRPPVTNAQLVCRLLLEKKKNKGTIDKPNN